ncbi:multidrug and toxin extrusion protein 1 isoform X1 [Betta splendens]|uniref:Multidrug and toxin extrusion protein n=1 Tax=Betta splendens TaxID=158456 RepID=A0A6P7PQI0_BETSP|nr:multidrug and toxin extrusion protein 1 isoform X1 [Betta splendens]
MEKLGSREHAHPSPGAGPVAGVSVAKTAGPEGEEAAGAVSSKLFRCACVKRWLPLDYREELYHVLRLTGPLLLSRILNFLLPFVITIFCGHIGNAELAGYALASATINVTTSATGYGLAVACDTLMSQTFGSKNLKRVGVILQRSSLILLLFCLPCWALLINSQNLLLILQQEDEVARIAQLYVMAFLPAVPAMFLHQLQVAYLQNQGIILPQMYTAAVANIFNLGFNYVLIFSLELGVTGSAIANSLSQITICLLLYGYIRWKKLHRQTWEGWSTDCLQEWGSYMKLAIPSAFMVCFEWWIWEIGGFLAGILGEVDLAAQHVVMEIGSIVYMFPLGINAATCVRVGNALGAGNTARAIVTCKVALVISGLLAVLQGVAITGTKSVVGYIFTSDENIIQIVSETVTVYTFVQFFDALLVRYHWEGDEEHIILQQYFKLELEFCLNLCVRVCVCVCVCAQCVCAGILVGSGMQKIAAVSNLICYYLIGLPVGVALMFAAKLRVLGLWLGLLVCTVLQTGFLLILIFRVNWKKVTHKAQMRAGKKLVVIPSRPVSLILNDAMMPGVSDGSNTAQSDAEEATKADGYSPVDTKDQEVTDHNTDAGGAQGDAEQSRAPSKAQAPALLSVSQLILRRGLTGLLLALILAAGVAVHIAVPAPEPSAHSRANLSLTWANDSTPTLLSPLDLTSDL